MLYLGTFIRGYLARDFIFFGVRTKYLAHIGAKKFEFMGTICLKSLIEHYLKKESFKICFFPFEITQLKKINKYINIKLKKIGGNMGQKLCWDHWKNINSGKIDSSTGIPRLPRFLVARFHFARIFEDKISLLWEFFWQFSLAILWFT